MSHPKFLLFRMRLPKILANVLQRAASFSTLSSHALYRQEFLCVNALTRATSFSTKKNNPS